MVGLEICRNFLSENELEMRYLFSSCNSLVMSRQKAERYAGAAVAEILEQELVVTNCEDSGPSSVYMLQRTLQLRGASHHAAGRPGRGIYPRLHRRGAA